MGFKPWWNGCFDNHQCQIPELTRHLNLSTYLNWDPIGCYNPTMKHKYFLEVNVSVSYLYWIRHFVDNFSYILETSALVFLIFFDIWYFREYSRDTSWYSRGISWYVMIDGSILIKLKLLSRPLAYYYINIIYLLSTSINM